MNRLYVVESGYTITGSMADHRRGVKPSDIPGVLAAIGSALTGGGTPPPADKALQTFIGTLAKDIQGKTTVFVAGHRQTPEVHAAVAAINAKLKAPVEYYAEPEDPRDAATWSSHSEQIKAFAEAAKTASAVLIIGANPVLTAPIDLNIGDLIKKAPLSIHMGAYEDETARLCNWHLPQAHFLEAWGDVRSFNGTVSIAQPLIYPLFDGKSTIEVLSMLTPSAKTSRGTKSSKRPPPADYMKADFQRLELEKAPHDGVIEATPTRTPEVDRR